MPRENTLQVFLKSIYFDRVTVAYMWAYVVTFVQANVDGDVQMYMSPSSFPITRFDSPGDDLVHRWDGAGALVASMPTDELDSVRMTTYLIRDRSKARSAGSFLAETFAKDKEGAVLAELIGEAVAMLPGGGAAATNLLKLAPPVANFIGKALMRRRDTIRIYGEGTVLFDEESDFQDAARTWSINRSDKGYFRTLWDFRDTPDPEAPLRTLTLPEDLRRRLGIER